MKINNNGHESRHELPNSTNKQALCRCWQSKKFPYCDGSHREYNAEHGEALGPVVISALEAE